MNKRTFLKTSSVLLAGAAWMPLIRCKEGEHPHNWAGNLVYGTDKLYEPATVTELQELVRKLEKLKVLGTRHSFSTIADSRFNLVSLTRIDPAMALDRGARTVTVSAGVRYGELSTYLNDQGFAVHNLASLPHISVAGACATATHGSGVNNGNLSTAVSAMEFITAQGDMLSLSREKDGDKFLAAVVHLGALGVVTRVTLDVQPAFMVRQDVYQNLPLEKLGEHYEEILSSGYSVSLFTDWQTSGINQVWIKRKADNQGLPAEPEFYGATRATRNLHPIIEISAENCTEQMGVPGPWHERLPHFKMGFTPSSGAELQAEYFVPFEKGVEAIRAVSELKDPLKKVLQISEVRTIAADEFWMSPAYKRKSLSIHFTLKPDGPGVSQVLPMIEKKLEPFGARPHWAKLFSIQPARLKELYEKSTDFQKLVAQMDSDGKFRNQFLEKNVFG